MAAGSPANASTGPTTRYGRRTRGVTAASPLRSALDLGPSRHSVLVEERVVNGPAAAASLCRGAQPHDQLKPATRACPRRADSETRDKRRQDILGLVRPLAHLYGLVVAPQQKMARSLCTAILLVQSGWSALSWARSSAAAPRQLGRTYPCPGTAESASACTRHGEALQALEVGEPGLAVAHREC
jgi:hypothetical protein